MSFRRKLYSVRKVESPKREETNEVAENLNYDIEKLAYAVATHETGNCSKPGSGDGNNCFGIKNGNTAPCYRMNGSFCAYDSPDESYEAFKIIWGKWYGDFPNKEMAIRWSGNDRASEWLSNVTLIYESL